MLHAPPDLDKLRTICDQALHGHHAHGTWHPPVPLVTIAAAHLDVLLRTIDPDQLGASTAAHNRAINRSEQHTRCIDALTTSTASLASAIAKGDQTGIANAARNLTRLTTQLKETSDR